MAEEKQTNYDVIVVGAGPAGMTAALYASRANLSVLMLDRGIYGGNLNNTAAIENYPGFKTVQGPELAQYMYQGATQFGAQYAYGTVEKVELAGDLKQLTTDMGDVFTAKVLVIATGTQQRHMGVPGEEEYGGRGVSYCAVCDGAFYKNKRVAVLGGGNTALGDAAFLADICESVTVIHRREEFRADKSAVLRLKEKSNVNYELNSVLTGIKGEGAVSSVTVKNILTGAEKEIPVSGLFVAIGQLPQNEAYKDIVELDGHGYIVAGEDCRTSHEGIFAAGDCRTKQLRQLVTAAADGAVAATNACSYIDVRF